VSVLETVFWFAVVPALILLVVGGLAWAGGYPRGFATDAGGDGPGTGKRYRPGRPYDAAPVWFLSVPEKVDEAASKRAVGDRAAPPALAAGADTGERHAAPQGSTGGASDRW
jgi:hypothetical protein